jgi:3-methyl-2-oxobutanoate hydroxymethyltransferase
MRLRLQQSARVLIPRQLKLAPTIVPVKLRPVSKKITTATLRAMKGKAKIAALTAYDFITAKLMDEVGIHVILVGDSVGTTVLGHKSTIPVTMEDMLHHLKAVSRAQPNALIVGDMPFLTYQVTTEQALLNAGRFIQEGGADAVKLEGGTTVTEKVRALVEAGIPVLGHIGLTPQHVHALGGYKVQGRSDADAQRLIEDARALQEAGAFAVVLEYVPAHLGQRISEEIAIPTIGIGAGPHCDGQVLVVHDMLGMVGWLAPRAAKRYANLADEMKEAFAAYKDEVEKGIFPGKEQSF